MSMNLDRHLDSFRDLFHDLVNGETDKADATRDVLRGILRGVRPAGRVLPRNGARWCSRSTRCRSGKLDVARARASIPRAIRRTALLTVEGERDDICSLGQTLAAHDLCAGLRAYLKTHYVQAGAGHYGVFSGKRWSGSIYPVVRETIQMTG